MPADDQKPHAHPSRHLISRKKELYPINDFCRDYLDRYGRIADQGARYEDLLRYDKEIPLYKESGEDTLWSTVYYPPLEQGEIHEQLLTVYALLKTDGDRSITRHLRIDRVDLCLYGNTLPFRVRVVNTLNENFDYFYVKRLDANRVYGLELEHILSPSRINYYIRGETIVEEHIIGIPADIFLREDLPQSRFDQVRLAKEFVKFNERCFLRLLGDMHAGNFVIDMRRDLEKWHYLMRPIDFDQQSHYWRKEAYIPLFFPQNDPFSEVGRACMAPDTIVQYQREERALIANRVRVSHGRFDALMEVMCEDLISHEEHVAQLRTQLAAHYQDPTFERYLTMGELVHASIRHLMAPDKPPAPALQNFSDPHSEAAHEASEP